MNLKFKIHAKLLIIVDILFAVLPAFVLFLTRIYNFKFIELLFRSDWSYISLLLFGQILAKMFYGLSINKNAKNSSAILLYMTLILILGLIPVVIILFILEISSQINYWALILQYIFLLIAIICYVIFGTIGTILAENQIIDVKKLNKNP